MCPTHCAATGDNRADQRLPVKLLAVHSILHSSPGRAAASTNGMHHSMPLLSAGVSPPQITARRSPQALFDLEATNAELKADLRDLYITGAREIDVHGSARKAVIIHAPFRLLKAFHKIQQRLVRELEKKFSGKDVVIVANRRIQPVPTNGKANARPRSRTLTAVSSRAR